MSEIELCWLAGFLEGEGSFRCDLNNRLRVQFCTSDEDVANRALSLVGGKTLTRVKPKGISKKVMLYGACYGKVAATLMISLFPHMGQRRRMQIVDALQKYSGRPIARG